MSDSVSTSDSAVLVEMGEVTMPPQLEAKSQENLRYIARTEY